MDRRSGPVLVTGASGFIGSRAVRRLLDDRLEVHVLLRPGAHTWRLDEILGKLRVLEADVIDGPAVHAAFASARPEAVLHFATHGAYEWQSDARRILSTNVLGTYNVLEAAIAAGAKAVVNAGSSSEYGYKEGPMRETDRLEPNSHYAVAKAAQTHLCSLMSKATETGIVTFRLFSVYGPWEEPARLIPTLIRRARAGSPLEMVPPETARDFLYVDDALDVLLDFGRLAGLHGEVFNLGAGEQSTMREVVAAVLDAVGSSSEVRWGAMPPRRWDTDRWLADVSKAKTVLGWTPRHSLREGIALMQEWMRAIGDDYGSRARRSP